MTNKKIVIGFLMFTLLTSCRPCWKPGFECTPIPTETATITNTIESKPSIPTSTHTPTPTPTPTSTYTPSPHPTRTPFFMEDFSGLLETEIIEEIDLNNCSSNFRSFSNYALVINYQHDNVYCHCTIKPLNPENKEIGKIKIRLKHIFVEDNTYSGFSALCGDVEDIFLIDNVNVYYKMNEGIYTLGPLQNGVEGYHDIEVIWGSPIQFFVDGHKYYYEQDSTIFQCNSFPTSIEIGTWLDGGQEVKAEFHRIELYGK